MESQRHRELKQKTINALKELGYKYDEEVSLFKNRLNGRNIYFRIDIIVEINGKYLLIECGNISDKDKIEVLSKMKDNTLLHIPYSCDPKIILKEFYCEREERKLKGGKK